MQDEERKDPAWKPTLVALRAPLDVHPPRAEGKTYSAHGPTSVGREVGAGRLIPWGRHYGRAWRPSG